MVTRERVGRYTPAAMMRYRLALALLLSLLCPACSMTVVPPARVKDPVTVHVVDYGRHASLVLPAGNGKLAEFSWGDWQFFALARTGLWEGIQAVLFSQGATLSRRYIDEPAEYELIARELEAGRIVSFEVERRKAAELLGRLSARYQRRIDTEIYNAKYRTYFVRDDTRRYCGLYNCTHETARWLKELGCRVRGYSIMSEFVLPKGYTPPRPASRPGTAPATTPATTQPAARGDGRAGPDERVT